MGNLLTFTKNIKFALPNDNIISFKCVESKPSQSIIFKLISVVFLYDSLFQRNAVTTKFLPKNGAKYVKSVFFEKYEIL